MSRTWKWILGVVTGLVLLAALGVVAAHVFGFGNMASFGRTPYAGHPMMEADGFRDRGPVGGFHNFRQPLAGRRGFHRFGGLFFLGGLLRLVFPLAILGVVAYFAYRKGKQDGALEALAAKPQEPMIVDEEDS